MRTGTGGQTRNREPVAGEVTTRHPRSAHLTRLTPRALSLVGLALALWAAGTGCTPQAYREQADRVTYDIIDQQRQLALGHEEPFTIEPPVESLRRRLLIAQKLLLSDPASLGSADVKRIEQWPDAAYATQPSEDDHGPLPWDPSGGELILSLQEALQIGARNSREYQSQKETLFQAALRLDLERDQFRSFWRAAGEGEITRDLGLSPPASGVRGSPSLGVTRTLKNGATFSLDLGLDLVKLLTSEYSTSLGVFGDASVSIPLMRGSGRFVVTEPLTQAERDVIYAIYGFERFKRTFAVQVATDFLGVLQQLDQVRNAEDNYRGLVRSTRRARRLSAAGRIDEIQVDQSRQDELSARNRWISAQQSYDRALDRFKTSLGLPTDAQLSLDDDELDKLADVVVLAPLDEEEEVPPADADVNLIGPSEDDAGPLELAEELAVAIALENRLDLRVSIGRVYDSQRTVAVAADNLRADLTLLGTGSAGSGRSVLSGELDDTGLRPERGRYSAFLNLNLPFERTAERNVYRNSLIAFERAVREVQDLEDDVKLAVRNDLRTLLEARETLRIQEQAVRIAERRVDSTELFLQAGRKEIRDLLEAREDLVSALNTLTAARVQYRVSELELQRDLDVLEVDERGIWREFTPKESTP